LFVASGQVPATGVAHAGPNAAAQQISIPPQHPSPQQISPAGQLVVHGALVHWPWSQYGAPEHTLPHAPQFVGSTFTSKHASAVQC
jgi:hypothetical protein